jgi:hypothetical protein
MANLFKQGFLASNSSDCVQHSENNYEIILSISTMKPGGFGAIFRSFCSDFNRLLVILELTIFTMKSEGFGAVLQSF